MVVTPDFHLQVVYICFLKVTHGGKTPDFYIYGKKNLSRSLMVAKLPIYIYIYIFFFCSLKVTHGGKTTDFYRYTYVLSRSLMVAKLPTFIYGKKQFSQGHSWWQNSRLSRSLMVAKSSQLLYFMFSQNWYTTNEKEHIAHHIKHFEASPKKQGKLRTKFVRSFQKH